MQWFLANYNEAKTMRVSKRMENARGTIAHVLWKSEYNELYQSTI